MAPDNRTRIRRLTIMTAPESRAFCWFDLRSRKLQADDIALPGDCATLIQIARGKTITQMQAAMMMFVTTATAFCARVVPIECIRQLS
jgi:hypothetical protein